MGAAVRDGLTADAEMNVISRYLVDSFRDAKELGSIITVESRDYDGYMAYLDGCDGQGQLTMEDADWLQNTRPMLKALARQAKVLAAKYPVVCTNPPYLNKIEGRLKTFVIENYKDYSGDLFSVFTYRNLMLCKQDGYCGYMTPFVWMFIKTYEKLREFIIRNKSIATLVQMEYSAFEEATVPICSFVLKNGKATENGLYFKLSDFKGGMEVQKQKVLEALADKNCGYFYEADQSNFSKIPGSPVAYWLSLGAVLAFAHCEPLGVIAEIRQGLATSNNDKYLRRWYEVETEQIDFQAKSTESARDRGKRWFPFNKGGDYRKWDGNQEYIVDYENDGAEMKKDVLRKYPYLKTPDFVIKNTKYYFRSSITWTEISSSHFGVRYCPACSIFSNKSNSIFLQDETTMFYLTGFLCSNVADLYIKAINPTITTNVGDVAKIPINISAALFPECAQNVRTNIDNSKLDWDSYETSWDFKRNPLV